MNFKDSFERMVDEIEKYVDYNRSEYLKASEIIGILRKQEGKSARDLNVIFEYISGKSLNRYIKDRKMMAAYKYMIKDDEYDIQSYIECSGYDNESSFSTAFSERFGISPKKAYVSKDKTRIEEPVSIGSLISESDVSDHADDKTGEIYGLPQNIIERYNEICEYQTQFGLENKHVELALYLNDKKGIELQDAFKTVEDLVMDFSDVKVAPTLEFMIDVIEEEVPVAYIKHLYPDVSLWELKTWASFMKDEGGNLLKETPEFVRAFFDNTSAGLSYGKMKEFYKDYVEKYSDKLTFMKYVELKQEDGDIEEYIELKKEERDLQEEFAEFVRSIREDNADSDHGIKSIQ